MFYFLIMPILMPPFPGQGAAATPLSGVPFSVLFLSHVAIDPLSRRWE